MASITFWPSRADAECDQQRDGRSLLVEADFDHRPVEDQPDDVFAGKITLLPALPGRAASLPCPADHVLAYPTGEQPRQCSPHPAGVHPGEIGLGDQRLGTMAEPLVGRKELALPFPLAIRVAQTGPRHRQLQRAEGGDQLARPASMAVAARRAVTLVAAAAERGFQLFLEQFLDEARTCKRTASSKGSNQSLPANGDGGVARPT